MVARHTLFVIALVGFLSPAPQAIVIRHDRDDARYVALAKGFGAYGDVVQAGSTLIAPRWLLTAGHVGQGISPYTSFARIGGRDYTIDRVILHPSFVQSGPRQGRDLALLRLATPVEGVEPIPLYRNQDEAGQTVTFMGRGQSGDGLKGPGPEDGQMRGATNKLDRVTDNQVFFQFDPPETATDLEGISGPGDSGGPALLKVDGKWRIAGVSSSNIGNGKGECRYGTTEVYARVSTAVDWIEETMRTTPPSTLEWTIVAPFQRWPESTLGKVAAALLDAYNTGDAEKMEAFNQKFRAPQALASRTPEARAEGYLNLFHKSGAVTVQELATNPRGQFLALLKNERGEFFQLSLFFRDLLNTQFDGYWIGPAKPRGGAFRNQSSIN